MMAWASALIDFVAAYPHVAYAAAFLFAFSEAVPAIGTIVPGSFFIIALGTLIPSGVVPLWPLLTAAFLGAILGDGMSYWLGHRYHRAVLLRWPLNRHPELVARSEVFVHRHGGKSVFLARFTPAIRAFVPLLAGILRMPPRRFYVANVSSALVWAPAHLLPGMLVGASFALAGAIAGRLAVLILVVTVGLWALVWAARFAVRRGVPLLAAAQARIWKAASSRDIWLARQVRSLLDPARKETGILALSAAVILGAAWLFFVVLENVVSGAPLVNVDRAIYQLLQELRTPWGDRAMIAITELGDAVVTTSVTMFVFLWLAWRRLWRTALYWAAAIGLAAAINTGIKAIVHRAPPEDLLYSEWSAFSFPSGHSTVNAVMYGFLAFLIGCNLRPVWRIPLFAAAFSWSALIAFSRLYLGVDWFSDVVGSLAFATAWVIVLAIAHVQHAGAHRRADTKGPATAAVAALVLAGGLNIWQRHATDVARYAVRYEAPSVTASAWWHADWQLLPAWRIDLTGELEEPLTFQWAGDLQRLDRELAQKGWHPPARWTIANALLWLMANPDPLTLPVVPYPNGGRMPRLTLVRADPDAVGQPASRLVLRLWASDLHLRDGAARRLWSGSVVRERLYRPLSLVTLSLAQPDANEARAVLATALDNDRLVRRQRQASQDNWDGQVLLAHDADIPVGEVREGQSDR